MTPAAPHYLHCSSCGKQVSTGFWPVPTDTPDQGLIVRAWIECPECIERAPPATPQTTAAFDKVLGRLDE